ncbi:flagellar hook-basal body protein FliE [Liquorilactobacillus sucicola DSM 21376 = JCM 15457]|uniref:Flagellar hook-basal body complex protein FliE n=2 Tax=Liquorilactobacillus sucicola TaxID=519050 RepID=A0A023CXK5_9LACO|nr:flagellar hook-basal body complex protein FliE [Liquorilactobacillus sucicola]AJA34384.1 flagellar hook-basal body complex protein FliE [Liquorilactobacillus sucicola]KRN06834.1 hypothetical protein FD15_GL000393 [Liquorilactobacillus sucicola DSM 21376 = JCM 15457]GAJ26311.1 flagellar hook-basal body protein FliE [Liquorilactobacillus sucicola DSM 21376 = JCM 15457]
MDGLSSVSGLPNYQKALENVTDLNKSSVLGTQNSGKQFGDYLTDAVSSLNNNMKVMDKGTTDMIRGDQSDLGSIMTKMTETQLSLQTAVQVRNKCLDAYNDLKNMQF